ncbi:MAG TPA: circadian clock KaiB family protein [Candidatus Binatus sp.]|nr:circadian clock KaiB family protein [Candidatus Binatus sp.]
MKKKIAERKKLVRKTSAAKARPQASKPEARGSWMMRLYIAGQKTRSVAAIANLRRICDLHVPRHFTIEVVDLMRNPELARDDQIVAIPTLVRRLPEPVRRIIGDLSAMDKVLQALEIDPV